MNMDGYEGKESCPAWKDSALLAFNAATLTYLLAHYN